MKTIDVSFMDVNLFFKNTAYLPNFVKTFLLNPDE